MRRPPDNKGRGLSKLRHLRPYVRAARAAGWTVELTRNGHVKFTRPDGGEYSTSPHEHGHSVVRLAKQLRVMGLEVDR